MRLQIGYDLSQWHQKFQNDPHIANRSDSIPRETYPNMFLGS